VLASPIEGEAAGQEFIETTFRGSTFRLPLDVDSWPLSEIEKCVGIRVKGPVAPAGTISVDYAKVAAALKLILGDQWPEFQRLAPKGAQLVKASNRFAAAVGIPAAAGDRAFGGLPKLLARLAQWPDHIESDLDRFWGIDCRDRWRFDKRGRRRLTLRQIHARLSHPPRESRLAIALNGGKELQSDTALAVMDLQEAITGRRHPSRPMSAEEIAARQAQAVQLEKSKTAARAQAAKHTKRHVANAQANALRAQGKDPDAQDEAG
jgi:hypothetical protein